ncbi:GNAT family N-acetyltransferase [Lysinibacillus xylanilyticus]|uniref:GNAT family N-acetyltransferase n=1 Tax=Lysinibacillus xylanilyticus TaxID=582475 RepID=UPI0036D75C73
MDLSYRSKFKRGLRSHWIIDNEEKVGIIIIHDISDTIPLFDIRLDTSYRGKGYGVKTLLWLQDYLFGVETGQLLGDQRHR